MITWRQAGWVIFHGTTLGIITALEAPLFGNDPRLMFGRGFAVGVVGWWTWFAVRPRPVTMLDRRRKGRV